MKHVTLTLSTSGTGLATDYDCLDAWAEGGFLNIRIDHDTVGHVPSEMIKYAVVTETPVVTALEQNEQAPGEFVIDPVVAGGGSDVNVTGPE